MYWPFYSESERRPSGQHLPQVTRELAAGEPLTEMAGLGGSRARERASGQRGTAVAFVAVAVAKKGMS